LVWITPAALKFVLLDRLFGEGGCLFGGLPLSFWKGYPLTNDFPAHLVIFHLCVPYGLESLAVTSVKNSMNMPKLEVGS